VRRLFEQKKNRGGCPDSPYQHPERTLKGNARTFVNLREKKMANFDAVLAPVGQTERSTLRV
jgi:hypothetical protein